MVRNLLHADVHFADDSHYPESSDVDHGEREKPTESAGKEVAILNPGPEPAEGDGISIAPKNS